LPNIPNNTLNADKDKNYAGLHQIDSFTLKMLTLANLGESYADLKTTGPKKNLPLQS